MATGGQHFQNQFDSLDLKAEYFSLPVKIIQTIWGKIKPVSLHVSFLNVDGPLTGF